MISLRGGKFVERHVYSGKGGKSGKWWKDQLLLMNKRGKIGILQTFMGENLDFGVLMS